MKYNIGCVVHPCIFSLTFEFSSRYQDNISDCLAVVKGLKKRVFLSLQEMNCTLFLLAGYAKYGQPYAWIRSNHERLVNVGGTDTLVKDTPMKLKSVTDWVSTPQGLRFLLAIISLFYYIHHFFMFLAQGLEIFKRLKIMYECTYCLILVAYGGCTYK